MTKNDGEESVTEYYSHCDHCGIDQTGWSVVVDAEGNVVRMECTRCGGTEARAVIEP